MESNPLKFAKGFGSFIKATDGADEAPARGPGVGCGLIGGDGEDGAVLAFALPDGGLEVGSSHGLLALGFIHEDRGGIVMTVIVGLSTTPAPAP